MLVKTNEFMMGNTKIGGNIHDDLIDTSNVLILNRNILDQVYLGKSTSTATYEGNTSIYKPNLEYTFYNNNEISISDITRNPNDDKYTWVIVSDISNFVNGDSITISGVVGMSELNNQTYYVSVNSSNKRLSLYTDDSLSYQSLLDTTSLIIILLVVLLEIIVILLKLKNLLNILMIIQIDY